MSDHPPDELAERRRKLDMDRHLAHAADAMGRFGGIPFAILPEGSPEVDATRALFAHLEVPDDT